MVISNEIINSTTWESFLTSPQNTFTPFFQSWEWSIVQEKLGNSVVRMGLYKNKKLVGVCLAVEIKAKRGHYLHVRHGPVLTDFNLYFADFLREIKKKAQELGVDFIRMSPLLNSLDYDMTILKKNGFRNAPIHNMDAENAWVLDLDHSPEELLSAMRKTTRYLVKKAQAMPITVISSTTKNDFNKFMKLYDETSKRHKFIPHRGIREEFEIFVKSNKIKLFLAEYNKKIIAGAFIVLYGNQAVYHHGATADEYKEIPAAYLLQWQAILEAQKQGKAYYNFWGVVPPEKTKHPWQGLTLFKTGFGGRRVNFIHAQDLALKPTYWKTFTIETLWKLKRGY